MEKIIRQCVLFALLAFAIAMTFCIPDDKLPQVQWLTYFLISKALGIATFAFIFNPKAPWSKTTTSNP